MRDHHAVIFIASGGNTTPVHVDPEPSFLLHIRGVKRFTIGRHPDPDLEQRELEAFYAHEGHYIPVVPVDPVHFALAPGQAVHVPPVQPHWVENGPEVTISFSVGFQTAADHQRRGVHQWNRRMRRLGLAPKPHGHDERRDRIKSQIMGSAFEVRRRVLRRPR
jgi:mannose-6-phosphate isomerase-like protein (cupin superfamily)